MNPKLLKITCPAEHADLISCLLVESGSSGVEERDAGTMTAAASLTEIIAGFETSDEDPAARVRNILSELPFTISPLRIEEVDDIGDEWKTKWREFFEPQVLAKLQIITPWMSPPRDDRISLIIDPGSCRGTVPGLGSATRGLRRNAASLPLGERPNRQNN